jgi:hypothetical protein
MDRRGWQRLLGKVLAYYLSLLLGLVALLYFVPSLEPYLPVGGLDKFSTGPTFDEVVSTYRETVESEKVFRGVYRMMEAVLMSVAIGLTLLIMVPIVWVYQASQIGVSKKKKDVTVLETLVVLPVIITGVVLIIQNSIALAFGLAGIVAGVQYRNRLALSVDAAYLFVAIAIGLASGIEAVGIGMVTGLWFCLTLIVIRILGLSAPAASPPD